MVKSPTANAGDVGSIPGLGRCLGEGNGNPLQYSCLENSVDGGAWWATVHGVAKSQTTERLHFTSGHLKKIKNKKITLLSTSKHQHSPLRGKMVVQMVSGIFGYSCFRK